jgi:hypothetical protein
VAHRNVLALRRRPACEAVEVSGSTGSSRRKGRIVLVIGAANSSLIRSCHSRHMARGTVSPTVLPYRRASLISS